MNDAPLLKGCTLYERTSAKGRTYFTGRLGGLKVVILRDSDEAVSPGGQPLWSLLFSQAEDRPRDGGKPAQPAPVSKGGREGGGMRNHRPASQRGEIGAGPTSPKRGHRQGDDPNNLLAG